MISLDIYQLIRNNDERNDKGASASRRSFFSKGDDMNELILPFKVSVKIGKAKSKYDLGRFIIKTKYKTGLAAGLCWLSFRIFFMGIKKLID